MSLVVSAVDRAIERVIGKGEYVASDRNNTLQVKSIAIGFALFETVLDEALTVLGIAMAFFSFALLVGSAPLTLQILGGVGTIAGAAIAIWSLIRAIIHVFAAVAIPFGEGRSQYSRLRDQDRERCAVQ